MTPLSRRLGVAMCAGCLSKMTEIDRLKRELKQARRKIAELKKVLGRRERGPDERPFGESTPSSKEPFKVNACAEDRQRQGGARPGHRGHGRSLAPPSLPPERVPAPCICSDCGGATESKKVEDRHVQDIIPERTINRHFKIETRECVDCGRLFEARLPGVAPRAKYTDALIVTALCQHYLDGRTQGDIGARLKIGRGAFNHAAQRLATALEPSMEVLVRRFIDAPVRFADESGMREDGVNRYMWLLSTSSLCLFLAGQTRAAKVLSDLLAAHLVSGTMLAGVLEVDRYAAYGCLPFVLQYCYAHLKRDAEALEKKFPHDAEVKSFCRALIKELSAAMKLRRRRISDSRYYEMAAGIKAILIAITESPARHPGVQDLQNVFRQNPHRLYHWAADRRVPAENNYSERGLRPWVIARHLSFGTQSAQGSWRRTVLMSVLHSLEKQGDDPVQKLCEALALKRADPQMNIATFLFPPLATEPALRKPPDQAPAVPAIANASARDAPLAGAA